MKRSWSNILFWFVAWLIKAERAQLEFEYLLSIKYPVDCIIFEIIFSIILSGDYFRLWETCFSVGMVLYLVGVGSNSVLQRLF